MGWRRWPVCRRVLVNLVDGRGIDGILYSRRGPLLIVRQARLLEPGADPVDVDGEILVERSRVSFIQIQP